jgi:hypothetical protein
MVDPDFLLLLLFIDGGGHVTKGSLPFILIVGSFRPEQVNDILNGFLDRVSRRLNNMVMT